MRVDSYRGDKGVSVFVPAGTDISTLPPEVRGEVGDLQRWKTFDMDASIPRVALDVAEALVNIGSKGYYISHVKFMTTIKDAAGNVLEWREGGL